MQTQEPTAPHFQEITRALADKIGKEITEDDLRDEFQKYLDYGVPPDQAVRTILRHHGGQANTPPPQAAPTGRVPLADIPGNAPAVDLKVRVLTKNTRTVHARGEDKEIFWGMVGDETASRPYTSWRPLEGIEVGDVLEVSGAYTKEWKGEAQVNFGDRTKLEKADAESLPTQPTELRDVKIGDIDAGLRGIRITGRILDVSTREVTAKGEAKTIWVGSIADDTGKIEFTSWHDHSLTVGQVLTIEGGYIRAFRGVPQFNFGEDAKVTPSNEELPDAKTLAKTSTSLLRDLIEKGGNDVSVVATILEVREGSGLIFRDPETKRVHPTRKEDSIPDLRIKAVVDDGTAAMSLFAGRELTEAILGKGLDTCLEEAQAAYHPEIIHEQLMEKLTGRVYEAQGNVLIDEYGAMFIARSFEPATIDVEAGAQELLDKLGGGQ